VRAHALEFVVHEAQHVQVLESEHHLGSVEP
jgi:hypothetical protein